MKMQLDYIFFLYGFGFIALGAVCATLGRSSKHNLPWIMLAAFGLMHGVNEWLDLLAMDMGDSAVFKAVRVCVMAISFVFLVEFGRSGARSVRGRGPGPWVTVLLLVAGCCGWAWGWPGVNAACRYSLAFAGGVWTGVACILAARNAEGDAQRRTLLVLGWSFLAYGLLSGLIVPKAPLLLATWLNQDTFAHCAGFPVQILRGAAALIAAGSVWRLRHLSRSYVRASYACVFVTSTIVLLAAGWLLTQHTSNSEYAERTNNLLQQCRIAAHAVNPRLVESLGSTDAANPKFLAVRDGLLSLRRDAPRSRFVYVTVQRKNRILFAADAEPMASKAYSPPGSSYYDAPSLLQQVIRGQVNCAIAQYHDRWGSWISGFAPIRDPATGHTVGALGIDTPQEAMAGNLAAVRVFPMAVTLLVIVIVIASYVGYERQLQALEVIGASEAMLFTERERLSTTLSSIGDGVAAVDIEGRVTFVNPVAQALTGWEGDSAVGKPLYEIFNAIDGATREKIHCPAEQVLRTGEPLEMAKNTILVSRDGTERLIADSCAPIHDSSGTLTGVVLVFRDETERARAEAEVRLSAAAMDAAHDLIAILDSRGRIVFANNAFRRQTGKALEQIVGRDLSVLVSKGRKGDALRCISQAVSEGSAWNGEMRCLSSDGIDYTADMTLTPLANDHNRADHFVLIARNVTERKVYEDLLEYQAHHDMLTELPNRLAFYDDLAVTLLDKRRKGSQCAVLFIDLDKFKLINDTLGHQAGDELLIEVAARLGECKRVQDLLARMGGDEFTVLLRHLDSADQARAVAGRMLEALTTPFEIAGQKLVIGASIGISIYPDNAEGAEALLRAADAAMYRAKEGGRNSCQFYSAELNKSIVVRAELSRDLRLAIERDELKVYYQPIVDVETREMVGAEALLRWDHPEKGAISPGLFIPVAEETGMITEIGINVLQAACRQTRMWQDAGCPEFAISVNVSPMQLRDSDFADKVWTCISEAGIDPKYLNLEITETMLANNEFGEVETLEKLKARGVTICLDDFGIGYSSLSRLKDFPIIHIKVDGSFIRDIEHSSRDRAMTASIISLAHSLGIKVTAEWIENEDQMAAIRQFGCDYAQGYLISPAQPAEDFGRFIQSWNPGLRKAA